MKNRTHLPQLFALLGGIVILIIALAGCSDNEDGNTFGLSEDINEITLSYPVRSSFSSFIKGGEYPYTITCDSDMLDVEYFPLWNELRFQSLGIGNTQVKVTDATGKEFTVKVTVEYTEQEFSVINSEVVVKGKKLNEVVKDEIREKALATLPVKLRGSYQMVYTGATEGKVYFYPDKLSSTRQEGTFKVGSCTPAFWDLSAELPMYTFKVNDQEYNFISYAYIQERSTIASQAFYEDLKVRFIKEYPEVEQVYTVQQVSEILEWNY